MLYRLTQIGVGVTDDGGVVAAVVIVLQYFGVEFVLATFVHVIMVAAEYVVEGSLDLIKILAPPPLLEKNVVGDSMLLELFVDSDGIPAEDTPELDAAFVV